MRAPDRGAASHWNGTWHDDIRRALHLAYGARRTPGGARSSRRRPWHAWCGLGNWPAIASPILRCSPPTPGMTSLCVDSLFLPPPLRSWSSVAAPPPHLTTPTNRSSSRIRTALLCFALSPNLTSSLSHPPKHHVISYPVSRSYTSLHPSDTPHSAAARLGRTRTF